MKMNKKIILLVIILVILFGYFYVYDIYEVNGNSMEPTLSDGDYIIVYNYGDVTEDDIIVYEQDNNIVVHRALYNCEASEKWITKGENNKYIDQAGGSVDCVDINDINGIYTGIKI